MDPATNATIVTAAVFIGVFVVIGCGVLAANFFNGPQRHLVKRVAKIRYRYSKTGKLDAVAAVRSIATNNAATGLELLARRLMPRPAELRKRLSQTGLSISLANYMVASVVVAVIAGLFCWIFFHTGIFLDILIGLVAGAGLPHFMITKLIERRLEKFTKLFPEAIDLIVRGLRSGLPITESINSVGQELPDPIGIEFRRIADSVKLGKPLEDALEEAADRLDTPDFKFFVIAISIQKETGGNLAETLENLSDILRKRLQMKLKVKAMSSEARASAAIIGCLPFLLFGVLLFVNYGYVSVLFTDPRGMVMGGCALGAMGFGMFVISRMIKFEI
jgi:tight adherence protein B